MGREVLGHAPSLLVFHPFAEALDCSPLAFDLRALIIGQVVRL